MMMDGMCVIPFSCVLQGRPHTPESRAKISAANKGKEPWNKGRRHSEETKARIRERTKQAMEEKKKEKLAKMVSQN